MSRFAGSEAAAGPPPPPPARPDKKTDDDAAAAAGAPSAVPVVSSSARSSTAVRKSRLRNRQHLAMAVSSPPPGPKAPAVVANGGSGSHHATAAVTTTTSSSPPHLATNGAAAPAAAALRRRNRAETSWRRRGTLLLLLVVGVWLGLLAVGALTLFRQSSTGAAVGSELNAVTAFLRGRLQPLAPGRGASSPGYDGGAATTDLIDMRRLAAELPFDNPDGGAWKQGWEIQLTDPSGPLTVIVVPHSHNDPGWIKTFDEYFRTQTTHILDTVVDALLADERRTFIWAEISYLSWWWQDQTESRRDDFRRLLRSRQLELVTGGWVQPDEANSELYALRVQLEEGHDWIRDHLGAEFVPRYGWAIDPFGYSPTMAWLLRQFGFEGMLIQRVHYAVKKHLAWHKHLEFRWRQTWDAEGQHDMLTHVEPFYSYDVPHTCGPDPSVCCQFDFHRRPVGMGPGCPWKPDPVAVTPGNVAERAQLLLDQYRKKAQLYRSNTVLIPLGDDFRYQTKLEAENQYRNHQLIHDYINRHVPGVTIKFGTLGEYFEAIKGAFEPPVLKGSFFTYSDVNEDYWSGYFTSRVFDKALDRQLERALYAAESLGATKEELRESRRQLSLFQHHDGVTGTAKNHVVEDYAKRMHEAITATQKLILIKVRESFPQETSVVKELEPCWMANSPRSMAQNMCGHDQETVIVFNPLETPQYCGPVIVPGKQAKAATLPCETPGPVPESLIRMEFDPITGLMTHPVTEEWKYWEVRAGGAYLFAPGTQKDYDMADVLIEDGGYTVSTPRWKRTVIEKSVPGEFGTKARVIDFVYEFFLDKGNQEWFVRFRRDIKNNGVFHTDLNGFNFDTHKFRGDMPIQSQVFPMPTLASIEDQRVRMSVLSEHAQGTASLENGSIDVWLDRRLRQDDNRGLGQGVEDNRPTRTRLRVVLEAEGFAPSEWDFQVTNLCRRLWDELQHPLELFGQHSVALSPANEDMLLKAKKNRERIRNRQRREIAAAAKDHRHLESEWSETSGAVYSLRHALSGLFRRPSVPEVDSRAVVPFVYMVYKRVDYLKKAIDSLRQSDFPKSRVPLIISHDGRVPEVVNYVASLKGEFRIIQLFHPYSCHEHPHSFPGDDPKLNDKFRGDDYGHPRSWSITCCKHHFTWMLKAVFDDLDLRDGRGDPVDTFLFLEEDYVVAPTVYEAVLHGLALAARHGDAFFGVGLDPTEGNAKTEAYWLPRDAWFAETFHSGPMTLHRSMFERLRRHAVHYCRFDDYNWDWSLVHLQGLGLLPRALLLPRDGLARHIGTADGMHNQEAAVAYGPDFYRITKKFRGTGGLYQDRTEVDRAVHRRGYGGWSHPRDQEHCLRLLSGNATTATAVAVSDA